MPLRIPKNQIIFNYTSGKEYLVLSTQKEYQGHYYEINGKFFAGKEFNTNAPEIIKSSSNKARISQQQNPDVEIYNKISGIILDELIKIISLPKLDDPNLDREGVDTYYVKKLNEKVIKQIDKDTYNSIKSNPLYSTVVIKGDLSNLKEAENQIPGITSFVNPPQTIELPLSSNINTLPQQQLFPKSIQPTGSVTDTPKPQDIVPVGPIYIIK